MSTDETRQHSDEELRGGLERGGRAPQGGKTPSSAPNNSFESGAGDGTTGYDSPPVESHQLSNPEVAEQGGDDETSDIEQQHHATPYYPPGGGSDGDPQLHDERDA